MTQQFNLDKALKVVKQSARIDGKDGVLVPLIKQLTEAALEAEIEPHLSNEIRNRKNGKSTKTMKSSVGSFELDVPRDRNASFEPQIVKKHQTHISEQIEEKIQNENSLLKLLYMGIQNSSKKWTIPIWN